jgi:hypothetical protein
MSLQTLPPEILLHILASVGSLSDLHALVLTCPRLYAVFRRDQAALMYQALAADLGPVMADALGLAHIQVLDGSSHEFLSLVGDALVIYGSYLEKRENYPSPRGTELEYVLRLVRWYRAVAFVAGLYMECALRLFEREVRPCCGRVGDASGSQPPSECKTEEEEAAVKEAMGQVVVAPPSRSERLRVLRAFYRLQILLHVWSSRWCNPGLYRPDAGRVNWQLFELWELWEAQQVFCAGAFYQRFRRQFSEIYLGESSLDPGRATLTKRLSFGFDEFRGFVGQVRATGDAAWQATLDKASCFLPGVEAAGQEEERDISWFRTQLYEHYRVSPPTERHRVPMSFRFRGDCVNGVPFGWVDALDGHLGYDYWGVIGGIRCEGKPTQGLWSRLGFVMWDAPRVRALKTSSFLSHCQTGWARSGRSSWGA